MSTQGATRGLWYAKRAVHRRDERGWSGIVEQHDAEDERTDPRMSLPDPVLAALTELDGPEAAAKAVKSLQKPLAKIEPKLASKPEAVATKSEAPTVKEGPRLRLPLPGEAREPKETKADPVEPKAPRVEPKPAAVPTFSPGELLDRLDERPAAAAQTSSTWSEYKELILSVAGGVVLLVGAVIYQRSQGDATEIEAPTPPQVVLPVAPPPPVVPVGPPPVTNPEPPVEPKRPAVTPMLSVVSTPGGALVEIDGVIYGRTPLIMPGPKANSLAITLKLDDHKPWSGVVTPNEAGHFNLSAKLEPFRR